MKNVDYWEKLIEEPPESYKLWFEAEKEYLIKNITKNSKVLDIGCGNGRIIKIIASTTKNIVGIDNEIKAINDSKHNLKEYPQIKILLADSKKLPFEDNSFDFIVCMASFVNFGKYKLKSLKEIRRVIKKEGYILIDVFSDDAFDERIKIYKKFKAPIKQINGTTVVFEDTGISEQFTKEQLIDIFNQAKLRIIEIKKVGIAYLCKLQK